MGKRLLTTMLLAGLILSFSQPCYAGDSNGIDLNSLISNIMSQPIALASFAVKLFLGLILGYFSVKALKYILALASVIAIGLLLDIWQLEGLKEFISKSGLEWSKLYPLLQTLISAFGILTVLPIGLGFLIGLIVSLKG